METFSDFRYLLQTRVPQPEGVVTAYQGGHYNFRTEETEGGGSAVYLDIEDRTALVSREGLISAVRKLPGGGKKLADWPHRLLLEPLNHFYPQKDGEFKALIGTGSKGDVLMHITRPKAIVFDPVQVFDMMGEAMARHSGHDLDSFQVDNPITAPEEVQFSLVDPDGPRFVDARPGDRTLGALGFRGSIYGLFPMELTVRSRRVLCANGMVSPDGFSRFRAGNEDEDAEGGVNRLEEWLRSQTEELFNGTAMQRELDRIQHLTTHEVDPAHAGTVFQDLFERVNVPQDARQAVLDAFETEADGTMYGVIQAFTRGAQSVALNPSAQWRLARDAGHASAIAQEVCEACQRALIS